jgi:glycosyltransferase 2 family protein
MMSQPAPAKARRGTAAVILRTLLSLLVSAFFVWLSLRHTNVGDVLGAMAAAPMFPLLGYFAILLIIHLVRTVRWGILLEPVGSIPFARLNSASAIGFMLLMVLPLRLGELARPLLVARTMDGEGSQLRRSGTLASCVVERVVDGLALAALGLGALQYAGATGRMADFARNASWLVGAAFLVLCVALVVAVATRRQATALLHSLLAPIAPHRVDQVTQVANGFLDALDLGSARRLFTVLALTVAHWMLHVVGFMLMAPAFGLELTLFMACTVLAVQAVGVMVPAGPGMVGTSQFFTQAALSIFIPGALSVPDVAARAAGYANAIWMLQFTQQVILGLLFWFAGRVSLAGLIGAHARPQTGVPTLSASSSVSF